jgi:nucleotide-binding universal stress UspA family protein
MNRILVPLDGSQEAQAAVPYALALAVPGTELILLTVISAADDDFGIGEAPAQADRMSAQAAAARDALEKEAQRLRGLGHTVQTEIAVGDPAQRILDTAAQRGASMIVMSSHGRGAIGRLLHGGIGDRVAREATVPVMIVRVGPAEPGPVGITRLVVPLDGSPLAEEALPVAVAISRRLGTPIFLVQAINPAELLPPAIGMAEAMPVEIYDETEQQLEEDAGSYLERLAKGLRDQGLPVATQVLNGPPATAIMEATHLGDVVVLCSHERTGVLRWLLGSVAEQLVRGDECPVIFVPASEAAKSA